MSERFIDRHTLKELGQRFYRRRHGVALAWVILVFALAFIAMMAFFSFRTPQHVLELGVITAIIMIGVGTWITQVISEYQHTLFVIEFQNALFAGAARQGNEFCIILKRDGSVIYVDPEFLQRFLPGTRHVLHMGAVWNALNMEEEDRVALTESVLEGKPDSRRVLLQHSQDLVHPFSLSLSPIDVWSEHSTSRQITLSIDPITRPSGFLLLRARDETSPIRADNTLESLHFAYLSFNGEGACVDTNALAIEWLGFSDRTQLMKNLPPLKQWLAHTEILAQLPHLNSPWYGELTLTPMKGDAIVAFVALSVEHTEKNPMERVHLFFLPLHITDTWRKTASDNASHYERLPGFLESSPIPTALLDERGAVISTNSAFRFITNQNEGDSSRRGWNFVECFKEDERRSLNEHIRDIALKPIPAASVVTPIEVKFTGKDASASLYLNRLPRRANAAIRLVAHLIDTTEQKNLEMRFVHSQKMQAVGQLAGGVAHDFNNLLTAMMGFCDLLLMRHPAGDQSFADIMQIKQNANRAANLVRQLLAFSRKQTLQPVVLNITDVLADVSNLVRRLIGENIDFKMVHGRELGLVKVDQGQLEQVIINLAVNARDAMAGAGGVLTLRTSNVHVDSPNSLEQDLIPPAEDEVIAPGDYVRVDVIDTGSGIPRNIVNKIFEPFFSTKEVGSGTGLGLSTVYGIVKQTDGYIYVASEEGKGTMFSIFLKRHDPSNDTAPTREADNSFEKADASDLTGRGTVLLVEDETAVRMFSVNALKNKGYTVLEADSGEKALDVMNKQGDTIEVIITDVIMPGMTGPAMIEQVSKRYPDIKVIFISGYAEDAFMETYGVDRHFHFLPKPYSLKQLAGKVKEVMTAE